MARKRDFFILLIPRRGLHERVSPVFFTKTATDASQKFIQRFIHDSPLFTIRLDRGYPLVYFQPCMRTKCRHRWDEKQMNIRVSPELHQCIKRVAGEKGMSKREFVEWAIWSRVQKAKFNDTDYDEIAEEIKKLAKRAGVPEHEALSHYDDVAGKIRERQSAHA